MADDAAAERVKERLKELAAFLEHENAVDSIEETVEHLGAAVTECMVRSRALAQQCTIVLFQQQQQLNVLAFLDASAAMMDGVRKRDVALARQRVLEMLTRFVKEYATNRAFTKQQIVDLVAKCQLIGRVDPSSRVKAEALTVVMFVLKYGNSRVTPADIEPAAYIDKLFFELKFGKLTQTAKGLVLEVIAYLVYAFPREVESTAMQLIPWVEDGLDKQFSSTTPELLFVKGLFICLAKMLKFYEPDRYTKNETKRQQVFSYVSTVMATFQDGQLSRYAVAKAALKFMGAHSCNFHKEIGENSYTWYSYMKSSCLSENKTLKQHASICADSVLSAIAHYLVEENCDARKKATNRIIKDILPTINDTDADTATHAFALLCLGKLAKTLRLYLGPTGLSKIETRMRKFGENIIGLSEQSASKRWSLLHQFGQCIGSFVEETPNASDDQALVSFLGDFVCHAVNTYPRCLWKYKVNITKPILEIFCAISKEMLMQPLLDRFTRHALLLTISSFTDIDDMYVLYHPETGAIVTKLLYEMETLWLALFEKTTPFRRARLELKNYCQTAKATLRSEVQTTLFHSLVSNICSLMARLDLTYRYELDNSGDTNGYKPNVPRDHSIMLNLTNFIERTFPRITPDFTLRWSPTIMSLCFDKARELPLVSSFYRIAQTLARLSGAGKVYSSTHSMQVESNMDEFRRKYVTFVRTTCKNLRFYKDELLMACTGLVLSTPVELITIAEVSSAMVSALELGRVHAPAADLAVTTLETWHRDLGNQLLDQVSVFVPLLVPYLEHVDVVQEIDQLNSIGDSAADPAQLQRRILKLVGRLGGDASSLLANASATEVHSTAVQGSKLELSFMLGAHDVTMTLSALFWHVGNMATSSVDRRTKACASEVFHALVCYLCGKTATDPHSARNRSSFHSVWRRTIPSLIALATDPEKICRALFEPLLLQIVRWFCNGSDTFPFEYSMILDELISGLCDTTRSSVRELCGKALALCLSMSTEAQADKGLDDTRLAKAEAIFERLFSLCRHPGVMQRMGAATAITYFLRTLNEENRETIQAFALRCVKNFLTSLRLCDRDDKAQGGSAVCRDMIVKALIQLQRAISRIPHLFQQDVPLKCSQSDGGVDKLSSFSEWVFKQLGSRELEYRRQCRQLFVTFTTAMNTGGCKQWLIEETECSNGSIHDVVASPGSLGTPPSPRSSPDYCSDVAIAWMEQLCASVESYAWCVSILAEESARLTNENATLSKKRNDERISGLKPDAVSTIARAVAHFVRWDPVSTVKTSVNAPESDEITQKTVATYIGVIDEVCNFLSVTSEYSGLDGWRFLGLDDREVQDLFCGKVIWTLGSTDNVGRIARIQEFCKQAVKTQPLISAKLTSHADQVIEDYQQQTFRLFRSDPNGNVEEMLRKCRFISEVMANNVLHDRKNDRDSAAKFVDIALDIMKRNDPSPAARFLATECVKIGGALGWDITNYFEDEGIRRALSPLYGQVVSIIPCRAIWSNCASAMVAKSVESTAILLATVDVLGEVADMKHFRPDTSDLECFVEHFLPHLKKLTLHLDDPSLETQSQRILMSGFQRIGEIFKKRPTKLLDVLSIGPVPDILECLFGILSRRNVSYLVKADALFVLSTFYGEPEFRRLDDGVENALTTFIIEEFPIVSTDAKRGSRDFEVFSSLIDGLLCLLEEARSLKLLRVLFPAIREGGEHIFSKRIKLSLGKLASNMLGLSDLTNILQDLTNLLVDPTEDDVVRQALMDDLFTPLMELQSSPALSSFFTSGSPTPIVGKLAAIISNSADALTGGAYLTASVAFAAIEILFRVIDPEAIRNEINTAFLGHGNGKGREFTMLICKCASKMATKAHGPGDDIVRQACCSAYNCLLTAVARTQKQEKFFDQILFQDSIWTNVVDPSVEYELHSETKDYERIPLTTYSSSTLQTQKTSKRGRSRLGASTDSQAARFFSESSLSQTEVSLTRSSSWKGGVGEDNRATLYQDISVELDDINQHPCMIPLLRVLVQMNHEFSSNWSDTTMPTWMQKLFDTATDVMKPLNIRLFLSKVVLNTPNIFAPYRNQWLEPVLTSLLEATAATSSGHQEFNYLLRDGAHLVLDHWSDVSPRLIKRTVDKFVNNLIQLAPDPQNFILQDNLMIIGRLIALWKDAVSVDVDLVVKFLNSREDNPQIEYARKYTALQVVSMVSAAGRANDFLYVSDTMYGGTVEDGLIAAVEHAKVSIFVVGAEVAGVFMAKIGASALQNRLTEVVTKSYSVEDYGRFLAMLRSLCIHQNEVLDSTMLHRVASVMPRVIPVDRWCILSTEILLCASKNPATQDDLIRFVQPVMPRLFAHRHAAVQYLSLQLLSEVIDKLSEDQVNQICGVDKDGGLRLLAHFMNHEDVDCRKLFLSILIKVHTKNYSDRLTESARGLLLQGFADHDATIREFLHEHWQKSSLLSQESDRRLVHLFSTLFSSQAADNWVHYASRIMLDMTKEQRDHAKSLFDKPLSDAQFVDAPIDATWETKTSTMMPMFSVEADVLASSSETLLRLSGTLEESAAFSMGSSSQAEFGRSSLIPSQLSSSQASGLTQGGDIFDEINGGSRKSGVVRKRFRRAGGGFSSTNATGRDSADRSFFKERAARLKRTEEAVRNRQRKARLENVRMRRKYRTGEYPDIQIGLKEILEPLSALCESDGLVARCVFADIFSSLVRASKFVENGLMRDLCGSLQKSLEGAKSSASFVSAVQRAFYSAVTVDDALSHSLIVPAKTIGSSSLASGNFQFGELIFEEMLYRDSSSSDKIMDERESRRSVEGWDQLYKLLSMLQQGNLLLALATQSCTETESKRALQARLSGDLPAAISSYKRSNSTLQDESVDATNEDPQLLQAHFEAQRCHWERLDCIEQLNQWDKLAQELQPLKNVHGEYVLWGSESPFREQGLSYFLRAHLGMTKWGDEAVLAELKQFVEDAQSDSEKWTFLRDRFSAELALAFLVDYNLSQARVIVEHFYSSFAKNWQSTTNIMVSTRLRLVQSLSSVAEVDEMVTLAQEHSTLKTKNDLASVDFVQRWAATAPPLNGIDINIWSTYHLVQDVVTACLVRIGQEQDFLDNNMRHTILNEMSHVVLRYAEAAVSNDILALTSKKLKDYRDMCNEEKLPKVSVLMVDVFVTHVLKMTDRQIQTCNGAISSAVTDRLTKYFQTATKMFDNDDFIELMQRLDPVQWIHMGSVEGKVFSKAFEFYMDANIDPAMAEDYLTRSIDVFTRSCKKAASLDTALSSTVELQKVARSRSTFIEFLIDMIFKIDRNKWERYVKHDRIVQLIVDTVLAGMIAGEECSTYFPQLCELIAPYPNVVARFQSVVVNEVPAWTCLRWSAQLMALLNGPIASTIVVILEKIAREYPVALFYDFKITCGDNTATSKVDVSRLAALVANPVMDKFVDALRVIHHPELRLKEGLREVQKLMEANKRVEARTKMDDVWNDCFSTERPLLGEQIGRYNREWARKAKRDMEKIMGKDGGNLTTKSLASAREWITQNFGAMPGKFGITKDMKAKLSDFAEWLDEFDPSKLHLELPGQYAMNWGKPDTAAHVRILSFSSMLGVLASKQLPKQITLHCSDEKDYTFLVKGGEDLRLDQRIEQLFEVMNQVLQGNVRCQQRSLKNHTYKVIPMTQEIGVIEWLHGTSTLKGIIENQLQQDERCADLQSNKRQRLQLFNTTPAKTYEMFLMKQRGTTYGSKAITASTTDVEANFAKVQSLIPGDLLRRQLLRIGADFESFLSTRDHFAKSLAVFSACSYILGIGDRHLDNFLLELASGSVIGVDFGVSFGAGASVLPVPELIPFRFTRQMAHVLRPYDEANLLAQDMQIVFEALREKRQVIESVMKVFLHEPLLDWQQSTTTHQKEIFSDSSSLDSDAPTQSTTQDEEELAMVKTKRESRRNSSGSAGTTATATAWLPEVKIAIARRKLEGYSPRALLKEELAQNGHVRDTLGKFQALVDFVESENAADASVLPPLEQAQELIALATSTDILGRTYHGWMPWL